MQPIMFTKHLEGLDVAGIIGALQAVGVQGADLCVRPGYPVTPENVASALPAAARQFSDAGLAIPLVTLPTSMNRPDDPAMERVYAVCGAAGVRHIKVGYWRWTPETHYWDEVERIRGYLAGFEALSKQHGVQSVVHTHSGAYVGLNASSVMHLVRGFDPQHVGIFADTGHLSVCGEPIGMALDMVRDYLAVVAFKDLVRERVMRDGQMSWATTVRRMGEGFVDWRSVLAALAGLDFAGPVSFHSEYTGEPVESVIDLARCDVRFVEGLRS